MKSTVHFACIRSFWGSASIRFPGFGFLILTLLLLASCTPENPSITAVEQKNGAVSGASLLITGTGFIAGNPVSVSVLDAPGTSSSWSQPAGNADSSGGIHVTVSYSYSGSSLPGCVLTGNPGPNYYTKVDLKATDTKTAFSTGTTTQVVNCGWSNLQVTAHQ